MIEVRDLGLTDYSETLALQQTEFHRVISSKRIGVQADEVLFLTEHNPVYTLGKHAHKENLLLGESELSVRNIDVYHTDRGGDITFHGPGQLVVYPIVDLERRKIGVKDYVNILEESVIRVCREYGIEASRLEGAPGVWVEVSTPRERKICALGVRCSRYVTMHGLALNVNTDMSYFGGINPCGFVDKGVTSISRETGRQIEMAEVKQLMVKNLSELLR